MGFKFLSCAKPDLEWPMGKLLREERLQIMLSDGELTAVDDWRFHQHMPSRAAAIRELLRRGLAAEGYRDVEGRMKSKVFGVVEGPIGEPAPQNDAFATNDNRLESS